MNYISSVVLLAAGLTVCGQVPEHPRNMFCGGNQLVDMGVLRADSVRGSVVDPTGAAIPRARVQLQYRGSENILREVLANEKGRFRLPAPRPAVYWLGVSCAGFNLHFWELRVTPGAGPKNLRVVLSLGT